MFSRLLKTFTFLVFVKMVLRIAFTSKKSRKEETGLRIRD